MPLMGRRPAQIRQRLHLVPGALHQFLQALPGRHLRADQDHLEPRQPHRRLPPLRRGHQGHPHRMPHRRRRPQPLSRLRRADRGRPRRRRREAGACRSRSTATPITATRLPRDPEDAARGDRDNGEIEDAEGGARRGRDRALCPHGEMGAVRIRPPRHRWELHRGFERYSRRHAGWRRQRRDSALADRPNRTRSDEMADR